MEKGWEKMKTGLSIIIPFVGEYPQVLFTIQATAQMLLGAKTPFEIIAVNNYCAEVKEQADNIAGKSALKLINGFAGEEIRDPKGKMDLGFLYAAANDIPATWEDKSGPAIEACAGKNPWLKYIKYDRRLSHWQAKATGVLESEYDTLLFMDAHTIPTPTITDMFMKYRFGKDKNGFYWDQGTMHFPLTYKILEWRRLIYKLKIEEPHFWSYAFTGFRDSEEPYEVPCMSTCGMMISRHIYNSLGGWPKTLGIYGGGENFMNFSLAVTGYKKFIYPQATLFHHGDRRDYHYNYNDMIINRMTAHYLFDGDHGLNLFRDNSKGNKSTLKALAEYVKAENKEQRGMINIIQEYTIREWADKFWTS
jgi:hypothetical protein